MLEFTCYTLVARNVGLLLHSPLSFVLVSISTAGREGYL